MSSHSRHLDWQIVQKKYFSSSAWATTLRFLELELITHCNPVMDCNTFPEERKMLLSCNQGDLISTVVAEAGARDRTPIAKMLPLLSQADGSVTARIK